MSLESRRRWAVRPAVVRCAVAMIVAGALLDAVHAAPLGYVSEVYLRAPAAMAGASPAVELNTGGYRGAVDLIIFRAGASRYGQVLGTYRLPAAPALPPTGTAGDPALRFLSNDTWTALGSPALGTQAVTVGGLGAAASGPLPLTGGVAGTAPRTVLALRALSSALPTVGSSASTYFGVPEWQTALLSATTLRLSPTDSVTTLMGEPVVDVAAATEVVALPTGGVPLAGAVAAVQGTWQLSDGVRKMSLTPMALNGAAWEVDANPDPHLPEPGTAAAFLALAATLSGRRRVFAKP